MNSIYKKGMAFLVCSALLLSFAGCAENPETPIVKNKDFDKMLEEAQETQSEDGSKIGMSDLVDKYDTYKTTVKNDSLNVTLNVDAKVGIPKVDKMSVIRVEQAPFTQEMLDRVRSELIGDTVLYEGSALNQLTKQDISFTIEILENEKKDVQQSHPELNLSEYDEKIAKLKKQYETAPDTNALSSASDGKLKSVKSEYNKNKDDEFYSWLYSFDSDADVYYGVSDGSDGKYISLAVKNSSERSNMLIFTKGNYGYESDVNPSKSTDSMIFNGEQPKRVSEGSTSMSREEAIKVCDYFLNKVGIDSFTVTECNKNGSIFIDEKLSASHESIIVDQDCYSIRYTRIVNGAPVNEGGDSKHQEGWTGGDYVKRFWHQEEIELHVNDDGIVCFIYNSPIRLTETVVESSSLKSFDSVKEYFEKMIPIIYASQDGAVEINISRVEFGYARISEKDSFDTGLLVPVWDFYGTKSNDYSDGKGGAEEKNIMTINAIDGTIIDRELGY